VSSIVVSETVWIPASAITVDATRASGPGGQHLADAHPRDSPCEHRPVDRVAIP
jgi:hypothetical protein